MLIVKTIFSIRQEQYLVMQGIYFQQLVSMVGYITVHNLVHQILGLQLLGDLTKSDFLGFISINMITKIWRNSYSNVIKKLINLVADAIGKNT